MEVAALTRDHPLADGRLTLLGAVETVTGAMTRLEAGGTALLIDCGIAQGRDADAWSFPEAAHDVCAVLLSHGHNDHVGSLPALLEGGFEGPIYGTAPTLDIAELLLADNIKLQGGSEGDVQRFRRRLQALAQQVGYDQSFVPRGFDGEASFREAGHILGSASVELASRRSRVIVSGDLGRPNSPILRDYCTRWTRARPLDLLVMEATYGEREHAHTHGDVERELERIIHRAIAAGGHILVPAFAIGRTQTLLYHLNTLVEAGRIPNLPVAVDSPMGLKVTELHARSRHLYDHEAQDKLARGDDPLCFDNLYAVERVRDSIRLRDVSGSMLIIAGSGMCNGGRIVGHLKELLPCAETCVLFVGYQAPGTPGRAIQDAARRGGSVRLDSEEIDVRANVETLSGLSAHADQRELVRWAAALPEPRKVVLHHGEPSAQRALAIALAQHRRSGTDSRTCSTES